MNAIQAERHVKQNGERVLSAVHEMRKRISGIIITSNTLQSSPNARQRRKKAQEP